MGNHLFMFLNKQEADNACRELLRGLQILQFIVKVLEDY